MATTFGTVHRAQVLIAKITGALAALQAAHRQEVFTPVGHPGIEVIGCHWCSDQHREVVLWSACSTQKLLAHFARRAPLFDQVVCTKCGYCGPADAHAPAQLARGIACNYTPLWVCRVEMESMAEALEVR